jgi:ATP-binding cassette, subfamily C, bacteriocin exporter
MENAKEWAIENPRPSILLLGLMMTSPIEKLLLPYLSAQIIKDLDNKIQLVSSVVKWAVVFVVLNICYYMYDSTKHSIATDLNKKSVKMLFNRIMDSEWSVSDNNVFELLSIIQSSNSYTWKIIDIAYSILGGQIFTLIGTVYIFSNHATWYVSLMLILSILVGFLTVQSSVESCRDDIKQYNMYKAATLSDIADIISSRSIIDKSKDKNKYITPALDSLANQNKKEYDCRMNVSMRIGLVSAITTIIIYVLMFNDLIQQNISSDDFTTIFFVSQQVFEMPLVLQNSLYENIQINEFENSVDTRFQKKKSSILTENKDIEVKNVKIRYLPKDQPQVHMKVKQGIIVSLTGPNGCGKSSLLRIIAGLEAPLNDDAVIMAPLHSMYVPQNANLINRSIIENVGLGLPRNPTRQEVINMLNQNNLKSYVSVFEKFMNEPVGELGKKLSGGQRQIVWMLRLIFSNKKTALLDEPTSWMSARVSESYLNCLRRNKITALIVTHDRNVQSFSDLELDWEDVTHSRHWFNSPNFPIV